VSIKVTIEDEQNGDTEWCRIKDGPDGYVVITGPGCYVAHEQRFKNGTKVITIKPAPTDEE
jgi:hypothetical protein